MNGTLGETLIVIVGVTAAAPYALAAYAIKRGWRVNTAPEKKPVPPADEAAAGGAADVAPVPSAVGAGPNGAPAA